MQISIIQIGKDKQAFITEAVNEFKKRLQAYGNVHFITLKESKHENSTLAKREEAKEISKHLSPKAFQIFLDEKGQQLTSTDFASELQKVMNQGISDLQFVIGGPYGLDNELKKHADLILSFSKMTFTHQMIRMVLVEQIYRAFTILNNKKYHY